MPWLVLLGAMPWLVTLAPWLMMFVSLGDLSAAFVPSTSVGISTYLENCAQELADHCNATKQGDEQLGCLLRSFNERLHFSQRCGVLLHKLTIPHLDTEVTNGTAAAKCSDYQRLPLKMEPVEIKLFRELLEEMDAQSTLVVEWGAGRTSALIPFHANKTVSLETSKKRCDKLTKIPVLACLMHSNALEVICVTPADTKEWGYPLRDEDYSLFHPYYTYLDNYKLVPLEQRPQYLFIHGRWRAYIGLHALAVLDADTTVVYFEYNRYADVMSKYYQIIKRVKNIAIMRRKPLHELPAGWQEAYKDYEKDAK
eukprot:gb/GEZN01010265.1/.p1 GENE.gb/GEZN01010265.1/~~gb/GEZN01010265.1/.p1  ORF type:complete len:311 (-),score=33.88 gb/GEZN01010265.1/:266-1198(-)